MLRWMYLLVLLAIVSGIRSAIIPALNATVIPHETPSDKQGPLRRQAFAPYQFETQFVFNGFSPEKIDIVKTASIGVIAMVNQAMAILTSPENNPIPHNPSFLRYFESEDLDVVKGVLQTILAVLGAPNAENYRGCLRVPKMELWYQWHRLSPGQCDEVTVASVIPDEQKRSVMIICDQFFARSKRFDEVDCNEIEDHVIDPGFVDNEEIPVASASVTFLHELLHWTEMTAAAGMPHIPDAQVTRTDNRVRTVAYKAFYAMAMMSRAWQPSLPLVRNADNYVFMVLELYYGVQCPDVLPWLDSPDSHVEYPPP